MVAKGAILNQPTPKHFQNKMEGADKYMNVKQTIIAASLLIGVMSFSAITASAQAPAQIINNGQCYAFGVNLGRGSVGQDVFTLQTVLQRENLLHTLQPTYYFGNLTFSAVVAFQERYASEILNPIGYSHGTGYVGLATRAKLNNLYGCGVTMPPIVGPGQHCGGNMMNAPVCQSGYYCAPNPGLNVPFGDVGGTCIANITTNQPPVISGVSGPTTLNIGQTGTWTITASDPENSILSYSVIWGDEVNYFPMMTNGVNSLGYTQTATFTHAYSSSRLYTPVFYVRDIAGNTATSSISANVWNVNTVQPAIQYLQPNGGVVGSSVTITGSGFTQTGNRIKFGNLGIENNIGYNLNSPDGRTIIFTVPYSNYMSCWNSSPACMTPAYMTQPGSYNVLVINANGQSNEVSFTVIANSCTPNWQCGWSSCTNGYQSMRAFDANNCGVPEGNPGIACPALARTCY